MQPTQESPDSEKVRAPLVKGDQDVKIAIVKVLLLHNRNYI